MKHVLWRTVPTVVLAVWFLGTPARAQKADSKAGTGKSESGAATSDVEEQASAILKKATDFLVQAQHFSVTVVDDHDTVQDSGVKIEYGATRKYTVRRPDRVRIDTDLREGTQ